MLMAQFPDFVVRERVYSAGTRLPRHSHQYNNISVIVCGEILEAAERGEHHGRYCSVVVKPAGCEHENRIGRRGARTLTIQILATSAMATRLASQTWSWYEQPEVTRAALELQRSARIGSEIESRAIALVDTVLGIREADAAPPSWMAEVESILATRMDEQMRFGDIANDLGLHPVYLSRAFRRFKGMSMGDYRRQLRLHRARHLLSSSQRSIAAIAAECGFSDASHLSHTFSELLGTTPNRFRRDSGEV
jgi:AraC family transcriptional regulator